MQIAAALLSLATPNLPRLLHFYQALLGIPPQVQLSREGEPVYVEFRLPGLRLGLYRSLHPEFAAQAGAASLCLQVQDLAACLGSLAAVLAEHQISVSPLRQAFHGQEGGLPGSRWQSHCVAPTFCGLLAGDDLGGDLQLNQDP